MEVSIKKIHCGKCIRLTPNTKSHFFGQRFTYNALHVATWKQTVSCLWEESLAYSPASV